MAEESLEEPLTQEFLMSQLAELETHISEKLLIQKDEIINKLKDENSVLKGELNELKEKFDKKCKEIQVIEKDVIDLQQYERRNNVEIFGIPNSVVDDKLEDKVIEMAEIIDVKIKKET